MAISVRLGKDDSLQLQEFADRLGLTPEELAVAAIRDWLSVSGEDFQQAAKKVLRKNKELYRRLS